MLPYLARLIGYVEVTEEKGRISISGIDAKAFEEDIKSHWNTARFSNNAINAITRSKLTFYSFFAIEFAFIISELLKARRTRLPKRVLQHILEELEKKTWIKNTKAPKKPGRICDKRKLSDLTVTLFRYQDEFIDIFDDALPRYGLKGYILGDQPGTGKTTTALATAYTTNCDTAIVIAPLNSVRDVWEATIEEIHKKPKTMYSSDASKPEYSKLEPGLDYYVFHYEALEEALKFVMENKKELGRIFIILDESHNLNESTRKLSKRTALFVDLCTFSTYVLWQSGTVFRAMGNEIIPCFITIDPMFHPAVVERFRPIYGVNADRAKDILAHRIGLLVRIVEAHVPPPTFMELYGEVPDAKRFTLNNIKTRMTEYIAQRLAFYRKNMDSYVDRYFSLVEKAKARGRIPENLLQEYLDTTADLHRGYDPIAHKGVPEKVNEFEEQYILNNLIGQDKHEFRDVRSVYKYVGLKVQGEALGRILGAERQICATAIGTYMGAYVDKDDKSISFSIPDLIDGSLSKTIIFTSYVETVNQVRDKLTEVGYEPLVVYGETNRDLVAILKEFTNNPTKNPLIATYQSLSTAVPLVMASRTITLNQPFRDMIKKQAIARTARIGQEHPTTFIDLYLDTGTEENLSSRNKDILQWSKEAVNEIMARTRVTIAMESLAIPKDDEYNEMPDFSQFVMEPSLENLPVDIYDTIEEFEASLDDSSVNVFGW